MIQYQSQRSHALSLFHDISLISQREDGQKTKTKQYTEQYRVLLVPRGKTELKTQAPCQKAGATHSSFYRNQRDSIPHREVLVRKLTRGIHSHTNGPQDVFSDILPVAILHMSTQTINRFWQTLDWVHLRYPKQKDMKQNTWTQGTCWSTEGSTGRLVPVDSGDPKWAPKCVPRSWSSAKYKETKSCI